MKREWYVCNSTIVESFTKEKHFITISLFQENRELTEEEEWDQLNERLKIKEQERIERELKQEQEDTKRFEELSNVRYLLRI
jgi:hypothetical protein